MRLGAIPVLCVLNLGLGAALVALWVEPGGELRDVRWMPPAPIPPNLAGLLPERETASKPADADQFLAVLDRPLFSATRRPPPPPAPPPAPAPEPPPPPPDPLAGVLLSGIYGGPEGGGAILMMQGKPRIVRLTESIGDWQVATVEERSITLKRGSQTRVLSILPLRELPPSGAASPSGSGSLTPSPRAPRGLMPRSLNRSP